MMARVVTGALIGAIPGAAMVLLTFPVSGELELTLGVTGMMVGILGMAIGGVLGATLVKRKSTRR